MYVSDDALGKRMLVRNNNFFKYMSLCIIEITSLIKSKNVLNELKMVTQLYVIMRLLLLIVAYITCLVEEITE